MKYQIAFILLTIFSLAHAQKIRRVQGEYKMKVESSMSMNDARRIAVQQAQIDALTAEFGTRVGMMNQTRMETAGGQTNTSFSSIANSLVKGLWLKDLQEPEFDIFYDEDDQQWISVKVVGRARSLDKSGISFEVKPLKCDNINCASQEYDNGQDLFLYFRSPESGYLTVFIDDKSTAFQVLPYKSMDASNVRIEADKEYYFFKAADKYNYFNQDLTEIDEYNLVTDYEYEVDLIYVLFSKEPFSKPILDDYGSDYPKMTESDKFNDWLADIMSYENMYMEVIDVSISK